MALPEIQHNFNLMNPQGNQPGAIPNPNAYLPDPRYVPNYFEVPGGQVNDVANPYISMMQMLYAQYPYGGFLGPNQHFYAPYAPGWRVPPLMNANFRPEINSGRGLYNPQSMRVNTLQTKDRQQLEVIDLESDQEGQKIKNSLVPPTTNSDKPIQKKPVPVIEIDENSDQQGGRNKKLSPLEPLKKVAEHKNNLGFDRDSNIPKAIKQLLQNGIMYNSAKNVQASTLKISGANREPRRYLRKKKKLIEKEKANKRYLTAEDKLEKSNKTAKTEKSELAEKNQKDERLLKKLAEKQRQREINKSLKKKQKEPNTASTAASATKEAKRNVQKPSVQQRSREISRHPESHGLIRTGVQFQSDVPPLGTFNQTDFQKWLSEKRAKLLKRQVGVHTY